MKDKKLLVSIKDLKKYFPVSAGMGKKVMLRAVDGISLDIYEGETLGIVGESGCGKSTLGRVLLQLYPQTGGTTMYYGRSVDELAPKYVEHTLKYLRKYIAACHKAEDAFNELDRHYQSAGTLSFSLIERRANARAERDKKISDVVRIIGGFMVAEDVKAVSGVLLRRYRTGAKLFRIRQRKALLETKHAIAEEKGSGSAAQKLAGKIKALDMRISALSAESEKLREEDHALKSRCECHPDFEKFEAMRDFGIDLSRLSTQEMRFLRRDLQLIFQDPYSSLNPRMTVGQIIGEGLIAHKMFRQGTARMQDYVLEVMGKCDLAPYMLHRYPHQFSGGQRQRIGIARALAMKPKFIVCDEAVSALDVSIQSQIINLLQDLREQQNLTYMFISHDLSVVKYISDRIAVMYLGNVVELAPKNALFEDARHPYTIALLSSIPTTELDRETKSIILEGSIPSPVNPPSGCKFHTRCFMACEKCSRVPPETVEVSPGHFVSCHFPERKYNPDGSYNFEVNSPEAKA